MLLIRDTFHLRPGQIDNFLTMMKAAVAATANSTVSRILTDRSGRYFTLVVEAKAETFEQYWQSMQAMSERGDPAHTAAFSDAVDHGHREIYNIEYEA
jgi:quinol monooxygenase YgiN